MVFEEDVCSVEQGSHNVTQDDAPEYNPERVPYRESAEYRPSEIFQIPETRGTRTSILQLPENSQPWMKWVHGLTLFGLIVLFIFLVFRILINLVQWILAIVRLNKEGKDANLLVIVIGNPIISVIFIIITLASVLGGFGGFLNVLSYRLRLVLSGISAVCIFGLGGVSLIQVIVRLVLLKPNIGVIFLNLGLVLVSICLFLFPCLVCSVLNIIALVKSHKPGPGGENSADDQYYML